MTTELVTLPPTVTSRGLNAAQWNTLCNSLFPGAKPDSVLLAVDYCKARGLDVLKKPCHIVPIKVKRGDQHEWRDVIMAGIYELRTTAMRSDLYLGHEEPEFGPMKEMLGVMAPEWCRIVVKRWNRTAACVATFPATVWFTEACATYDGKANQRWAKAPIQMLEKCTEAAALRKGFPDELGGQYAEEEMAGKILDEATVAQLVEHVVAEPTTSQPAERRRRRGKPDTKEPEPTPADAPPPEGGAEPSADDRITKAQRTLIEGRLHKARIPPEKACEAFAIKALEELPWDMVGNITRWIEKNATE